MDISFIIPGLNCQRTLGECLESIVNLIGLPTHYEVILVLCQANNEELAIARVFQKTLKLKKRKFSKK